MDYAALIVTFNRKEKLVKALKSLLTQSVAPKKIVLVDNASTDGTYDYLVEQRILPSEIVDYHRLEENMGGAGGFEKAFIEVQKLLVDWVSIADDDGIYEPGYFSAMANAVAKHHGVGAFVSTVMLPDGRVDTTHRFTVDDWKMLRWTKVPLERYNEEFDVDVFTFVGALISMPVIKQVGLPEAGFFIWFDDLDYAVRTRKVTRILHVPAAKIVHDTDIVALDSKQVYTPDWREYYGRRNAYYTVLKDGESWLKYPFLGYKFVKSYIRPLHPRFKGYRYYEYSAATAALKDFLAGRKGVNPKFKPGSSKNVKPGRF